MRANRQLLLGLMGLAGCWTSAQHGDLIDQRLTALESDSKDQRQALFVVPLLVNPIFLYGLLPFMCGMPLMFLSLAVAVRQVDKPTRGRGIGLAVLALERQPGGHAQMQGAVAGYLAAQPPKP